MSPLKLNNKTTLLASAITLGMFLAMLLLVSVRMVDLVREDEMELARLQAVSVAEQISLMPLPRDQDDLTRAMSQARGARPNVDAVRLWERSGDTLIERAVSSDGTTAEMIPRELQDVLQHGASARGTGTMQPYMIDGHRVRFRVFVPIIDHGQFYGVVEVVERLNTVPSIVRRYAQTAWLLALITIILTTLAIYLLFRYLVYQPMNGLIEAMARVTAGSLDVRVPASAPDEFGRLATGFNKMIEWIRGLTREREAQQEILRERVREATEELQAEIVERRRAETESQAAAERYRVIFDSNPLPMWVYDPETLSFLTVNEAAVTNYGWTREEFLQLKIQDIHPVEETSKLLQHLAPPESESGQSHQWRHRRKDGSLIEVEVFFHDLIYENREARLVIASDITEKKRIEAGLLRSQRLESLGTLASGIAHDLNNILSPLSLSTYLLRSKVTDPGGQATLNTLEEVIERGSHLVKQVLSFARGAEGDRVPLNPKHVMREVVGLLKETLPKSINLKYHAVDQVSAVLGKPTQLHQVLMNLCVNARDAMPEGGDLKIAIEETQFAELDAQLLPGAQPGRYVMISVTDTGVGIPPEIIDKIFDPFFTTKDPGQGTGLGLSTSLGIVRSHGGFINVYSEPGTGSQFKVYLPALEIKAETTELEEEPEPPAGHGEWILLVDDEEAIRRMTRGLLEAFNYQVLTAADGREACALYRDRRAEIRVVLTDMMMPIMDGAAVISELRSLDPHLPIVASSGLAETGKENLARGLGAQEFLSKPYTAARLLWVLHDLLHNGDRRPDQEGET